MFREGRVNGAKKLAVMLTALCRVYALTMAPRTARGDEGFQTRARDIEGDKQWAKKLRRLQLHPSPLSYTKKLLLLSRPSCGVKLKIIC